MLFSGFSEWRSPFINQRNNSMKKIGNYFKDNTRFKTIVQTAEKLLIE